jgi:hypothetical protein
MPSPRTRRHFLQPTASAAEGLGLGEWAELASLSPATTAEATVTPDLVRFGPDIEPVVRLIEETPRAKRPAMMIGQLWKVLPYRIFLAALFLANLRLQLAHQSLPLRAPVRHTAVDVTEAGITRATATQTARLPPILRLRIASSRRMSQMQAFWRLIDSALRSVYANYIVKSTNLSIFSTLFPAQACPLMGDRAGRARRFRSRAPEQPETL